jgi:hypothetical protein
MFHVFVAIQFWTSSDTDMEPRGRFLAVDVTRVEILGSFAFALDMAPRTMTTEAPSAQVIFLAVSKMLAVNWIAAFARVQIPVERVWHI